MRLETCFGDNFTQEYTVNLHSGSFFFFLYANNPPNVSIYHLNTGKTIKNASRKHTEIICCKDSHFVRGV